MRTALASYSRACRIGEYRFLFHTDTAGIPNACARRGRPPQAHSCADSDCDPRGNAITDRITDGRTNLYAVTATVANGFNAAYAEPDDCADFDAESISDAIARSYGYAEPGANGFTVTRTNGDALPSTRSEPKPNTIAWTYCDTYACPDCYADAPTDCNPKSVPCANPE